METKKLNSEDKNYIPLVDLFDRDVNKTYIATSDKGKTIYKEHEALRKLDYSFFLAYHVQIQEDNTLKIDNKVITITNNNNGCCIFRFKNTKRNIKLFITSIFPKMKMYFKQADNIARNWIVSDKERDYINSYLSFVGLEYFASNIIPSDKYPNLVELVGLNELLNKKPLDERKKRSF